MNDFLIYLLKTSGITAIFYTVFVLFFARKHDYHFNRIYLLGVIALSVTIPLISVSIVTENIPAQIVKIADFDYHTFANANISNSQTTGIYFDVLQLITTIYWFVFSIFLFRFILFGIRIHNIFRYGTKHYKQGYYIIKSDKHENPFSFFHYLFIRPEKYLQSDLHRIIEHEKIHISQYHSVDVLLSELFSMFLWFNPFVFFLKNAIRSNHEFLADTGVIQLGFNPINYQKLLVNEALGDQRIGFANNFKSITIKKRIKMISKYNSKTKESRIYKMLLVLPLLCLTIMIYSFKSDAISSITDNSVSKIAKPELDNPPRISPINKADIQKISAPFGHVFVNPFTKKEVTHKGVDMVAKTGTKIYAPADGIVVKVKTDKGYGNYIVIQHDTQFTTLFSHLETFNVKKDQEVKESDLIGTVGSTGYSTGPHLHYEVIKNGKNVDPELYFD